MENAPCIRTCRSFWGSEADDEAGEGLPKLETLLLGALQVYNMDRVMVCLFWKRFAPARCASFTFHCDDRRAAETARQVCTVLFYMNFQS